MDKMDDDIQENAFVDAMESISNTTEDLVNELCDIQIRHCKRMIKALGGK